MSSCNTYIKKNKSEKCTQIIIHAETKFFTFVTREVSNYAKKNVNFDLYLGTFINELPKATIDHVMSIHPCGRGQFPL
jgi:hypothetical protein